MSPAFTPGPLLVNVLICGLCLVWGSTWVVIKEGLRDLPWLSSAGVRFGLAAACMALFAAWLGKREGGIRPGLTLSLTHGLCIFAIPYTLVYWSETRLPSGLVAVIWATYPLMMAGAGHLFLPEERLRPAQGLGVLLGFVGVCILQRGIGDLGPGAVPASLLLLLSPMTSTFGTIIVKRRGGGVSSLLLNRNGMSVAAVLLLGGATLRDEWAVAVWTGRAIFSVSYLAFFGTVVAFGVYMWLLRYAPATRLSLIAYVTPLVALSLGWVVADEKVAPWTVLGCATILLGVGLARLRR